MAILVDSGTRLVVQGLTGSEGRFHGLRNRSHGTNVVAGVTSVTMGRGQIVSASSSAITCSAVCFCSGE